MTDHEAVQEWREMADTWERNGHGYGAEQVRAMCDAIEALEKEQAAVRAMLMLSWPPPLSETMPDGTLPAQVRAWMDADILAHREETERALSSLKREVLEAIAPLAAEYARIRDEDRASGFAVWDAQHDGTAAVYLTVGGPRGAYRLKVTAGEVQKLAELHARISRTDGATK